MDLFRWREKMEQLNVQIIPGLRQQLIRKSMEKINSSCISVMAEAASECSRETLRWDHLEIQMEKHL